MGRLRRSSSDVQFLVQGAETRSESRTRRHGRAHVAEIAMACFLHVVDRNRSARSDPMRPDASSVSAAHDAGAAALRRHLEPDDELVLPLHKRAVVQYARNDEGATELRLFHDDKEISFDEPELFTFGEMLAQQARFVARDAVQWGEGLTWSRVQGLLDQLVDAGILRYADPSGGEGESPWREGARPSPLPPAATTVARSWSECETLTRELTGRTLELAHLELVVPVFRVAHMALDADDRQVGEANVFPPACRLDRPTNWRACIYPGTRHLDERPMNVTALKAMRSHWGTMMTAVLRIRAAFLRRFPEAAQGWTVGHLERLSTAVLAVPTYPLMRMPDPVGNGRLHPALSSLFRVTDGVRMTMHQMLFIPIGEPTTLPDAPVTAREIIDYAERNYSFHSDHGVCAGPRAMIEEFLGVLVDGVPARNAPAELPPEVEAALADVERAIDYGLHGLRAYAAVFSVWPIMTRTYERLWAVVQAWVSARDGAALRDLAERMRTIMKSLETATYLGTEQWRVDRQKVYADMHRQCGRGLGLQDDESLLTQRIAPHRTPALNAAAEQVRAIVERRFEARAEDRPHVDSCVDCLVDFFSQVQAILGVATETQRAINALLGRPAPKHPFSAAQIDIHVLLQARKSRQVPDLCSELDSLLGFAVAIEPERIAITAVPG